VAKTHQTSGLCRPIFQARAPLGSVALLVALSVTTGAQAAAPSVDATSQLCDAAAIEASARTGVPLSVLKAISLTETGKDLGGQFRPWPWTVNMEGRGTWFESEEAARAYASEHFERGARSFDVGCFQINYKWHHDAFASIDEMFDPLPNALYAARFLARLYAETGSWDEAAGAYHSRTPEYAEAYKARFAAFRARFTGEDGLPLVMAARMPEAPGDAASDMPSSAAPIRIRVNTYPLLQGGGGGAIGSLVPLADRALPGGLFGRGDAG